MNLLGRGVTCLWIAALLMVNPFAHPLQVSTHDSANGAESGNGIQFAVANAPQYPDYPLGKLQKAVPALHGLKPDPSQDQLSSLLENIGLVIKNLVPRLPNLISRETVSFQSRSGGGMGDMDLRFAGIYDPLTDSRQPVHREYSYLILSHHAANGPTRLEEQRSNIRDHRAYPLDPAEGGPRCNGFAYQWLFFLPNSQKQLRFRYLGKQKIDHHETYVVAFAQSPDRVATPGTVVSEGKAFQFFYQGVAWIDQSTYRVVVLRTDLLEPVKGVPLQQLTTELRFSEVHIPQFEAVLWLPREVRIAALQGGQAFTELHWYSNYHLYHATARILPSR